MSDARKTLQVDPFVDGSTIPRVYHAYDAYGSLLGRFHRRSDAIERARQAGGIAQLVIVETLADFVPDNVKATQRISFELPSD